MNSQQEETFRNLWEAAWSDNGSYYHDFRDLAKAIRPDLTDAQFDRGWQFCNVTHPNFKQARTDLLMLVHQTL